MIRTPRTPTVVSLLILGTGTAHAEILNVSMVAQDHSLLSLSFDLNTAATTDAFSVGSCGSGEASGVYTNFSATGGISNASLLWDGVSYSLQSSNIFLDNQSSCDYDLDMRLTFNNNTTFTVLRGQQRFELRPRPQDGGNFSLDQSRLERRVMIARLVTSGATA